MKTDQTTQEYPETYLQHEQAFAALVEKLRARYGKALQFNHEIV